jgi:hydrogenase expression/formation protein HypE
MSRTSHDGRGAHVDMSHGGGGRAMQQLIDAVFKPAFDNPLLARGNDQAEFALDAGRYAFSTDSYVISPLFFPGGDIGSLAVHGTINDLAMGGAIPLHLSAGFIIEEGFPIADLRRIAASMGAAARDAGVAIVTGDTKVVERGKGDGVFINTAGIGRIPVGVELGGDRARVGDSILVSGSIGDHGIAIMASRAGLSFETTIQSDSAALHTLVAAMLAAAPGGLRTLRDPTRGGLAATLNEIAQQSRVGMRLDEAAIPLQHEVRGACELLGLDPLNIANEGKLIAVCSAPSTAAILAAMHAHPLGQRAACIGQITEDSSHFVEMRTVFGGRRMVDWLHGEQLPRIC